jgi:microcystin-dependent protein
MSQPFLGEIRAFGFNFAPRGWAMCNGQILPIAQNTALFSLLGTTYGGNGQTTFALPNLQSRVPLHFGQGPGLSSYALGEVTGTESVSLLITEMPAHNHLIQATSAQGDVTSAAGGVLPSAERGSTTFPYNSATDGTLMNVAMVTPTGGSQPHQNIQPVLALNYCIALEGIFPSRN